MASDEYDVIILGGGPVGENLADRVVHGGLSAVIVEGELVGGECSYRACTPSKAMLRPGAALRAAQAVRGATMGDGGLDPAEVLARRTEFVADWSDAGQVEWLESAGIALIRGTGRISGEREITVTDAAGATRRVTARVAVAIATGSEPTLAPIDGIDQVAAWTSRDATAVRTVPASLAIIGGGVVAVEMATAFCDLGTAVTVIARGGLLTGFEAFVGERTVAALRERGVTVHLNTETTRVERSADGVTVSLGDGRRRVHAAELLVATGRRPRIHALGLESIGVDPDAGLTTDDTLRVVGVDWLYAVGDANGRAPLTHQGKYQARAAGDAITARAAGAALDAAAWGRHAATADHAAVPQVVFADPEVASVGRTEAKAREDGLDAASVDVDFATVAGATLHRDGYQGTARLVIDREREVVVGATFVGPDVAELLHAATIAIVGEVPLSRLWHAVPVFPTMSEIWLRLLEQYGRPAA